MGYPDNQRFYPTSCSLWRPCMYGSVIILFVLFFSFNFLLPKHESWCSSLGIRLQWISLRVCVFMCSIVLLCWCAYSLGGIWCAHSSSGGIFGDCCTICDRLLSFVISMMSLACLMIKTSRNGSVISHSSSPVNSISGTSVFRYLWDSSTTNVSSTRPDGFEGFGLELFHCCKCQLVWEWWSHR